jgi:hypothetical protein
MASRRNKGKLPGAFLPIPRPWLEREGLLEHLSTRKRGTDALALLLLFVGVGFSRKGIEYDWKTLPYSHIRRRFGWHNRRIGGALKVLLEDGILEPREFSGSPRAIRPATQYRLTAAHPWSPQRGSIHPWREQSPTATRGRSVASTPGSGHEEIVRRIASTRGSADGSEKGEGKQGRKQEVVLDVDSIGRFHPRKGSKITISSPQSSIPQGSGSPDGEGVPRGRGRLDTDRAFAEGQLRFRELATRMKDAQRVGDTGEVTRLESELQKQHRQLERVKERGEGA